MTTNEKRQKIQEYCHGHICWADPNSKLPECEHKCNKFCSNYSETCASPKTIDEWYKFLCGEDVEDRNEEVEKLREEKAKLEMECEWLREQIKHREEKINMLVGIKATAEAFLGRKIEV